MECFSAGSPTSKINVPLYVMYILFAGRKVSIRKNWLPYGMTLHVHVGLSWRPRAQFFPRPRAVNNTCLFFFLYDFVLKATFVLNFNRFSSNLENDCI